MPNIVFSAKPGRPDTELREEAPFLFHQVENQKPAGDIYYEVVRDDFDPSQEGEIFSSSEIFGMLHEAGEL